MKKEIEISEKIKLIFYWNEDKITRIFDLKHNKEINNIINNPNDKTLTYILTIVLDFIKQNFNLLTNNIELPELFQNLSVLKFILVPIIIDNKKISSLFLNIENNKIGLEIEKI